MALKLVYRYMVYVIYFLGIGMTSSGIVLMPFNTFRYSIILSIGLGLFLTGSFFNEVVINGRRLSITEGIRLVATSLTLAIGIGMISGGISHFKESPRYVSYLIPLGLAISFSAFSIREKFELTRRQALSVFSGVAVLSVALHFALALAANIMMVNLTPGGDIFKMGH